jgi:non-ribosomal peptide synthetase component E (peptide arylation enzyme)
MDLVATHAARHPDKAAIVDGEHTLSWRAFYEKRNRVAQALGALGLRAAST